MLALEPSNRLKLRLNALNKRKVVLKMDQQDKQSETLEAILQRINNRAMTEQASTGQKSQTTCDIDRCFLYGRSYQEVYNLCDRRDLECPIYRYAYKDQLVKCGIYERYQWATLEKIREMGIPDKNAFDRVSAFVDRLDDNLKQGNGLILKGNVGTGKTTLAAAVIQEMVRRGMTSCYFVPLASLLDEIFSRKGDGQKEYINMLKNCRLLVIDDLGQEHSEGWVQLKFENIISERYNRCRSTILTTNLGSEQMKGRYTERIIDRFRESCDVINFAGASLRGAWSRSGRQREIIHLAK